MTFRAILSPSRRIDKKSGNFQNFYRLTGGNRYAVPQVSAMKLMESQESK